MDGFLILLRNGHSPVMRPYDVINWSVFYRLNLVTSSHMSITCCIVLLYIIYQPLFCSNCLFSVIPQIMNISVVLTWNFCFSERTMDLKLNLQNTMSLGLLWCGISGRELGQLGPNTSMVLDLNLITIRTGLLVRVFTHNMLLNTSYAVYSRQICLMIQ